MIIFISLSYCIGFDETKTTIIGDIKTGPTEFNETQGIIVINAEIVNIGNESKIIYIAEVGEDNIEMLDTIGVAEAKKKTYSTIKIYTKYPKKTYNERRFAVLLSKDNDGKYPAKFFMIKENWQAYEKTVAEQVLKSNIVTIPLIAVIVIILIILIINTMSQGPFHAENLFFPKVRDSYETIAAILVNPITWVFEIILIIIMAMLVNIYYTDIGGNALWSNIFILSGLCALLFPIIYLAIGWFMEKTKGTKPLRFFWGLFLFGTVAAYIAFVINTYGINLVKNFEMNNITYLIFSAALMAPIIEETVKSLGLFITSLHSQYSDAVTGLLFGFSIGLGFSFIENWFYFSSRTDPFSLGFYPWVQLIIYRSVFNSLAHGIVTGTGGAIIGHVKSLTKDKTMLVLAWAVALMLSIPLHAMFNVSAIIDGTSVTGNEIFGLPIMFNPLIVVLLVVIFAIIYFLTVHEKKFSLTGFSKQGVT